MRLVVSFGREDWEHWEVPLQRAETGSAGSAGPTPAEGSGFLQGTGLLTGAVIFSFLLLISWIMGFLSL